MGIWVDTNGWIVPFPMLLGCLVAEILYFRGWWILINGARAKSIAAGLCQGTWERGVWQPQGPRHPSPAAPCPYDGPNQPLQRNCDACVGLCQGTWERGVWQPQGPRHPSPAAPCPYDGPDLLPGSSCRSSDTINRSPRMSSASAINRSLRRGGYRWNDWHWRSIVFIGAIIAFLLAVSAPIDILAGRLFWVHMVQHLLLLVIVPPLLVASAPLLPWWLGLPRWGRKTIKLAVHLQIRRGLLRAGHWLLRQPVIASALLVVGIWVWHWPPLYDLALTDSAIHDWCEHTTFLIVSILFWAQIIPSPPFRPSPGYLGRIGCVAVGIAQNVMLAVLIGFAPAPLYAPYAHLLVGSGGFSPLQDQQFGAGIMWTFGDLPFGIAFSILIHRWLAAQTDEAELVIQSH